MHISSLIAPTARFTTSVNGEVEFTDGANYTMGTESQYTLYAVWEANLNTLNFHSNGATGGSTRSMQVRTGESVSLNANGFIKKGYAFKGWSTSINGEVEYTDCGNYTMETNSSYILYAVWETIVYGIKYELYGGINDVNNPKTFTIEDLPLQLNCPTKEGETFTVFYSDSKFSTPLTCINEIGDIVLHAEFTESTFGVEYSVLLDHVRVVGCESNVTHVKVLSYYCGKKVTNIEQGAFKNCNNLEFISLPFIGGAIDATTYARPFGYIFGYNSTAFDSWLPKFLEGMNEDDVLMITADHGCDPGDQSTDHTREMVPLFIYGKNIPEKNLGTILGFDSIGSTAAKLLGVEYGNEAIPEVI